MPGTIETTKATDTDTAFDFDFNAAAKEHDERQQIAAEEARQQELEDFIRDWKLAFEAFSYNVRQQAQAIYESDTLSYSEKVEALQSLAAGSTVTLIASNPNSDEELAEAHRRINELEAELATARSASVPTSTEQVDDEDEEFTLVVNAIEALADQAGVELSFDADDEVTKHDLDLVIEKIVSGFQAKFQPNGLDDADRERLAELETQIRKGLQQITSKVGVKITEVFGKINIDHTVKLILDKLNQQVDEPTSSLLAEQQRLVSDLLAQHGKTEAARIAFDEIDPNAEANKLAKGAKIVVSKLKGSGVSGVITYGTVAQVEALDTSLNVEENLIKELDANSKQIKAELVK